MYAFRRTLQFLEAVFASDKDYIVVLAFLISAAGFLLMQFAFDHELSSISATIIRALGTATLFFLSTVGFITFISTLFVFAYNLSLGPHPGGKLGNSRVRLRTWRMVLSFVIAGAATAAAFNCFIDGLKEVTFIRAQYSLFLPSDETGAP